MQDIGHSSLLKFLVKNTMSEKNIESNVPGEHNLREVNDGLKEKESPTNRGKVQTSNIDEQNQSLTERNTSEIATADFTLSPVITVMKNEATFTKGDLKLQKVTVTEDISRTSTSKGEEKFNRRLTYEIHTSVMEPESGQNNPKDGVSCTSKEEKEAIESKRIKTKIPMSRLRQAVNRVKEDLKEKKRLEKEKQIPTLRKSSIPRLKDIKTTSKETHTKEETVVSKADEEFDRIFNELNPTDTSLEFINIENVNQIENSFEEIIHAYEEDKITSNIEKTKSRIPLLKRKSEHDIEIPKTKEKQALKKSKSVDTKTSFNQGNTETIVSQQTKAFTQSNSKTEKHMQKEIQEITNNNTVIIEKQTSETSYNINNTENQESNSNEIKETIKVATPDFNIQTTEEKLKRIESIDKSTIEDLTQDITITKNLNFDKETVSKIYKIDFTENNFDSLDMPLLNETIKRDQTEIQNENNDSKTIESINYNENIQLDNKINSISDVNTHQIENNYISKETQLIQTNEQSNIKIGSQSSIRQVSLATNETSQLENNNISKETQLIQTNEQSDIKIGSQSSIRQVSSATNETSQLENNNISKETTQFLQTNEQSDIKIGSQSSIRQVSSETNETLDNKAVNITSKTSKLLLEVNSSASETLQQSVKTKERNDIEQESYDTKTIELCTNLIVREGSLEEYKTFKKSNSNSSISVITDEGYSTKLQENIGIDSFKTSVRQVSLEENSNTSKTITSGIIQKTTESNEKEKLDKMSDKTETLDFDKIASSKNDLSQTNTTLDIKDNRLSIESSIQSLKSNTSKENDKRNQKLDKTFEDFSLKVPKTIETENLQAHEDISIECLKNKRNKSTKLEELSRRYENIEFDIDSKKTSEANKNIENKTNTGKDNSAITTDVNKNIPKIEEIGNNNQALNKNDRLTTKSISFSANNKLKETVTQNSSSYSNVNKQTLTSNKLTASNTLNTRDVTKSTLNTQSTEEINKIYSEVFTKMNAQNKQSFGITKETKEVDSKFNTSENNIQDVGSPMEEDIPILRGKVNRVIQRISSIDNTKSVEKNTNDLPKKISVISKIQMFERVEPDDKYPKKRIPKLDSKTTRIPTTLRQTSTELRRPKIVKEIYKDTNEIKTISTENTSRQDNEYKEHNSNAKIIEGNISRDTKLKDQYRYSKTDTNSITDYKQFKDVKETNNKSIEDATIYESVFEKTIQDTESNTQRLINTNVFETKTERINFENINKESNAYTKIYTNNSDKSIRNKTINIENHALGNEDVFNFTPKEIDLNNKEMNIVNKIESTDSNKILNIVKKDSNTTEFINEIYKDNKAKSLEHIRQDTRKSYERLQSDKSGRDFDMRRTTSVAELEIGGVVKGRVYEMIMRINSMEILSHNKKDIQREQPRKSSVSEKIALFEGKLPPIKTEKRKEIYRIKNDTEVSVEMTEEDYAKKIEELKNVKNNYETILPEYLELRDNSEMPVIALGTALLDKRLIKDVVEAAIEMGYRAIDTAYIYGNEKEIGEAINNKINDGTVKREDLYIMSKLWSTYHRRDLVEKACKQSLDNMGLTYFDLYLIHNPMSLLEGSDPLPKIANVLQYSEHDYMDAWRGIEDLVLKGLVRRGGVSNFNSEQIHRIMEKGRIKPVVNQVECHPYLSQERLGGFCDAYGMRLSCYGVLGSKGTPAEHKSDLPPVIDDPLVTVMAAGVGVTPGQMLVAYQLHNSRSVVLKATSAGHLYDNLKAQYISLEPSHLTALKSLNKNKRTYYLKG
ncbi:PREDICTED: protein MLP1-like [Papilio polytes]|uniref:protein MLP1-like n=1 Tax=Papilio polytes TaxID=76194 RepID=UPI000676A48C|nr:PREDICTED: protein MLP1-like [Papilio polytes]